MQLKRIKGLLVVALLNTSTCFLLVWHLLFTKPFFTTVVPPPPIEVTCYPALLITATVTTVLCMASLTHFNRDYRKVAQSVATRLNLRPNTCAHAT